MSEHQGALAEQVAALRRMAQAETEGRREMERAVEDSRDRERRLLKAIAALEGVPTTKAAARKPKARQPVGADVVEDVHAAAVKLTEGNGDTFTLKQLGEASGRSPEAVRRALDALRGQERIRSAGKQAGSHRGMAPNLYALMPNGD